MPSETIASMAVRIGVDLSDFTKDMAEFQKTFGKLGRQLQQVGTQIGAGFTAAGVAVAAGLGTAVSTAMDFDAQMSRVGAIAGGTAAELEAMRQTALELGASTSKSASEVAVGMELMATKGYEASEVMAAMPGVIAAAEASGEDMALVADTVASALNAFQMKAADASRVADILAMSANTSAAGIQDLQYSFKYAAPVANALGISMEQLAAATGIMADSGMKGEQAGTTLRAALLRLTDPPKEAANQLKALGVSVTDAAGNFLPFDQIVAQLSASTANLNNAQKAQALSTIFGTEAMTGMLSLIEAGPEKFRSLTTEMQNSEGVAQLVAELMRKNLKGSFEELFGAIETAQILFTDSLKPALIAITDALRDTINWFSKLSPETKQLIAIGASLAAGLLVLTGVVGFLAVALGFLAAAEWAVILPIAGIIAAVVAVIAIIAALAYVIYDNWDTIEAYTVKVWEAVKSALQAAWDWIVGLFKRYWAIVGPIVTAGWDAIKAYFKAAYETLKTIVSTLWETIKTIFATAFLVVYNLVTGRWDEIGKVFAAAGEKLKSILGDAWDKIKGIWSSAFETIGNAAQAGWDHIKGLFTGAWDAIKKFFLGVPDQAFEIGKNMMQGMMDGIASMANALAQKAKQVVESAVNAAKNFLGINSPSKLFMQIGAWTGEGFAIGLDDSSSMVGAAAQNMAAVPLSGVTDAVASTPNVSMSGPSAVPTTLILEMDGRVIAQKTFERMGGTLRLRGAVT
ncbi:phage tail tape measure protein [Paenibacillus flagellatus]|uniref:Phage tail tape measure protein n=1 Tax=Paenibacillus flagellatus TaxID=2211139 RepID=A0A2V5K6Q2_9BACL|nr:phage tail tape measure protein [Paenibacillus flagellatus]PYI54502.1 phage tail tape measure protein [Paenibacillus flagellatus]